MTPFDGPVVPEEQMIAAGRVFALLMRGALNERAIINLFQERIVISHLHKVLFSGMNPNEFHRRFRSFWDVFI